MSHLLIPLYVETINYYVLNVTVTPNSKWKGF